MRLSLFSLLLLTALFSSEVDGHGRLIEPPSRASMFRYGFPNPPDWNDMQGFCGGKERLIRNGGRCGVCGDPWDATIKPHEAGGKYANGIIVREYTSGQSIQVQVEVTANHKGYFEFRLCVNNNVKKAATHECMNQNVLQLSDGSGTRYYIDNNTGIKTVRLDLPANVVCTQCVFQWKYHVANSWGTDPDGTQCMGCGLQEEFYACADVSISGASGASGNPPAIPTTTRPSTTTFTATTTTTTAAQPVPPKTTASAETESRETSECRAVGLYANVSTNDEWCRINCPLGNCPSSHCSCDGSIYSRCRSHGIYKSNLMDAWCYTNCESGFCPLSHCTCN